ncbi:MAG TPA: HAMP domain-containing histidine kinase [Firmicutes bacterium]|mgnify:CR=1 FL=1|nr:HAMP domain-containing histidine kinase [Bacillota bacterium]
MFKRIFAGYLIVLLIALAALALTFSLTVRHYLINDTIDSLTRTAESLALNPGGMGIHGGGHMRGVYFSLANRIAYADYLLLLQDGTIVDSSDEEAYPPGSIPDSGLFAARSFEPDRETHLVDKDLVAVSIPAVIGDQKGTLILYSQLDLLTQLNRSLLGLLALALAAGTAVSLLAGAFITRVIVNPVQKLKEKASALARREFGGKVTLKTGDELEELANTINEMATKLAEYDLAQKDFFQKASHELKTPLMSIQGYAEAIKDGTIAPAENTPALDVIIRESSRMKTLVEQFIYLSKMERVKETYSFEAVNLDDAVRETVYALQNLARDKNIDIETVSGSGGTVQGDPEKIHRLLLNIIGNALRYASQKVRIKAESGRIEIADDGPGFAENERIKAFKPFYRGKGGGSGLGLAISKAIVEKHGGTIALGNRPQGGAVVTISLPLSKI